MPPGSNSLPVRCFALFVALLASICQTNTSAAQPIVAQLTYPADQTTNVDLTRAVQWTPVPNAQAYYLYVGSTTGMKDLLDTREIHQTSYLATGVPANRKVFARLWTRVGGVWRFSDSAFTTSTVTVANVATLTSPADGAIQVDFLTPMQWTLIPNAQAYYLYVGTQPGTRDIVDTREIQQSSYLLPASLPASQTLYARLWTKVVNIWRFSDSSFTTSSVTAANAATLTSPTDGATDVDVVTYQWTSVPDAQAYVLYIGTTVGAYDFLRMRETQLTSHPAASLPGGATMFARLWTKVGGVWRYRDSRFTVAATSLSFAPRFVYPTHSASGVNLSRAFEWTRGDQADAYTLWVGSSAGTSNLVNSGTIEALSYQVSDLPSGPTLYASVWSRVAGKWTRHSDIAFTLASSGFESRIVSPVNGATGVDGGRPFEWADSHLAQAYRLTLGRVAGGSDLHDSGEIRVVRRFVGGLPVRTPLFGRVHTKVNDRWFTSDFTFSLQTNTTTEAARIEAALWAATFVRAMTPPASNRPFRWTPLWDSIYDSNPQATCGLYTEVVLRTLTEMNVGLQMRRMQIRFSLADVHVLAEVLNRDANEWMIVDATFGLAARRTADGGWASVADVAQATVAQNWTAIEYVFPGPQLDAFARAYYIDYPLLFLNDYVSGSVWHPAGPYLDQNGRPRRFVF